MTRRSALLGLALLVTAVVLFFLIDAYGQTLRAPEPLVPGGKGGETGVGRPDAIVHVLIALAAVLVVGRLLGFVFRFFGQPPVIGEVVGGILLGPSVLGQVWPDAAAFILPPSVAPYLG